MVEENAVSNDIGTVQLYVYVHSRLISTMKTRIRKPRRHELEFDGLNCVTKVGAQDCYNKKNRLSGRW